MIHDFMFAPLEQVWVIYVVPLLRSYLSKAIDEEKAIYPLTGTSPCSQWPAISPTYCSSLSNVFTMHGEQALQFYR